MRRCIVFAALLGLASSGCAGLGFSLFSSEHYHYHETTDTEKKMKGLERRIRELEAQLTQAKKQTRGTTPPPVHVPADRAPGGAAQ